MRRAAAAGQSSASPFIPAYADGFSKVVSMFAVKAKASESVGGVVPRAALGAVFARA